MIHEPQSTLNHAQVIKKINKWTIEQYINPLGKVGYAVTDGWRVYYPIIYHDGSVAYDNPDVIPQTVKRWFQNYAYQLQELR